MSNRFTGEESATDILNLVLRDFSKEKRPTDRSMNAEIVYQDGMPVLKFDARVKDNLGDFLCYYRLDKMLLIVFPECERIYDEADENGLFGDSDKIGRNKTVRHLAYYAMNIMLRRLTLLQLALFEENFNEAMLLTASTLFNALAQAYQEPNKGDVIPEANAAVRTLLDATVDAAAKKKRELLIKLLNSVPPLHIQTGPGRPLGKKKKKAAAELDRKSKERRSFILYAMRELYRQEKAHTNVIQAEDAIKRATVAKHMNISRTTLNEWLKSGGHDFEELKEEAIKTSSRN